MNSKRLKMNNYKGAGKKYRKQIYAFSILFIIALLQSSLLNYFPIFNLKPDAILASLVLLVCFFSPAWSVIFAFLAGAFRDLFGSLPFGFNTLISIAWVVLAGRIFRRLSAENMFIRSAVLGLIILLNNLALQSLLFTLGRPLDMAAFLRILTVESMLSLLLALPMYRFFLYLFIDQP
jgi:cell shape-determining protein MreD